VGSTKTHCYDISGISLTARYINSFTLHSLWAWLPPSPPSSSSLGYGSMHHWDGSMAAQACQRCKQLWPSFCTTASCSLIMNVKKLGTSVNYMRRHHNSFGVPTLCEACWNESRWQKEHPGKPSAACRLPVTHGVSWWGFSREVGSSRAYLCWCRGPYANHVMAQVP